jgi:hypothetical protein
MWQRAVPVWNHPLIAGQVEQKPLPEHSSNGFFAFTDNLIRTFTVFNGNRPNHTV